MWKLEHGRGGNKNGKSDHEESEEVESEVDDTEENESKETVANDAEFDSDSEEESTEENSNSESSESEESDLPREYKNALKKAESYLGSGFHFSETGLRGQLEFEEFPQDAIDYCGKGKPQLTGRANYIKMGKILGYDLVGNPDLMLNLKIATEVMLEGMCSGKSFSGDEFSSHIQIQNLRKFIAK